MGNSIRLDIDLDSRNRRSFNGLEAVQGLVAVLDRIGKAWWGLVMLGEVLDDQAPRKNSSTTMSANDTSDFDKASF